MYDFLKGVPMRLRAVKVFYRFMATRDSESGPLVMKMPGGETVEIEAPSEMVDVMQEWITWWERVGPAVHANN